MPTERHLPRGVADPREHKWQQRNVEPPGYTSGDECRLIEASLGEARRVKWNGDDQGLPRDGFDGLQRPPQ